MRGWTLAAVALALAFTMLSVGCRRRRATQPTRDARVLERYERNLIRIAARDSRCPAVQIQPVRIAETIWTANTCTGPYDYELACRHRSRWSRGCSWRRIATVPEAAQSILMCPPQGILQQPTQQPMVRYASGCGRQVQMNLVCNGVGCGWVAAAAPTGAPAQQGGGGTTGARVIVVPAQ